LLFSIGGGGCGSVGVGGLVPSPLSSPDVLRDRTWDSDIDAYSGSVRVGDLVSPPPSSPRESFTTGGYVLLSSKCTFGAKELRHLVLFDHERHGRLGGSHVTKPSLS